MDASADARAWAHGGRAAIDAVATDFVPLHPPVDRPTDPLPWPGYEDLLAASRARSGADESVTCGRGRLGDTEVVLISFDFRFVGGSIGQVSGDRIAHAFRVAREHRLPVVSMIASGGSRMQEGMVSLHQLQRAAAEVAHARRDGIPHISVLRDPTTGGVWASLGAGADVILAVAGAQIGFAGRRVRPSVHADHPAFLAEGQFAAGNVDAVLASTDVAGALRAWLHLLRPRPATLPMAVPPPGQVVPANSTAAMPRDGWSAVRAARSTGRPRAAAYLARYFDSYYLINGDRCGGRGTEMLCGVGTRDGDPVAFAAQDGSPTTPAGYRTAVRLVGLAERFGLPVLTLVDTPGAATGAAAEASGLAAAIAELFVAVAATTVPVTSLVIGEGGSGGALALTAPGNTWITTDAYFSVIAPELAAAILKRDAADAPVIADLLRLRPQDLVQLGLVRGIVSGIV